MTQTPAEKAAEMIYREIFGDTSRPEDFPMTVQTIKAIIQTAIDEAVPKWQAIESAPKDGTEILLAGQGVVTAGYWDPSDKRPGFSWMTFLDGPDAWNHDEMFDRWQLFPQPPEDAR